MEYMKPYEILLKKAKSDYLAAQVIYENEGEIDLEIALFHLQQAVEKSVKAILIYNKIEVPRTHRLDVLGKLIRENGISIIIDEEVIELNDYAVEGRYDYLSEGFENFIEVSKIVKGIIEKVELMIVI